MTDTPATWRSIESAPKDGTKVLLFTPSWTQNGYVYESAMLVAWFDPHEEKDFKTGEYGDFVAPLSDGHERKVTDEFAAPTHWMHLPAPPE